MDTSFLASFDYHSGTPADPIVFNVAPLNVGGHYDITTGIYTVPTDGVYEFSLHLWNVDDPEFNAYLEVDNVTVKFSAKTISLEKSQNDSLLTNDKIHL